MRESVRDVFVEFTTKFEGCPTWMYLDKLGAVRVGPGCFLEPIDRALELEWFSKDDGHKATPNEISADWVRVKKMRTLAHMGSARARFVASFDLNKDGLEKLVFDRIDAYEKHLVAAVFPDWESYPANAQLAMLSIGWVLGPAELRPELRSAVAEQAWNVAAENCFLPDAEAPERKPRNWANRKLLVAAGQDDDPEKVTGWP